MVRTAPTTSRRELLLRLTRVSDETAAWTDAVRSASGLCVLVDADGCLVAASAGARRALGATADPGTSCDEFWIEEATRHNSGAPHRPSVLHQARTGAQPLHSFVRLLTPAGAIAAEVIAVPLTRPPSPLLVFLWPRSAETS